MAQLTNGNVVAAFVQKHFVGGNLSGYSVCAQIATLQGEKVGNPIVVQYVSEYEDQAPEPSVTALTDGRFLVVYETNTAGPNASGVKAFVSSADGASVRPLDLTGDLTASGSIAPW